MKLKHAIGVVSVLQHTAVTRGLSPGESAALVVLIELGKRVTKARGAVREVAKAIYGDELNQADLFGEPEEEKK